MPDQDPTVMLPVAGALDAHHGPRKAGAPRADEPGEADDLALAHVEVDGPGPAGHGKGAAG